MIRPWILVFALAGCRGTLTDFCAGEGGPPTADLGTMSEGVFTPYADNDTITIQKDDATGNWGFDFKAATSGINTKGEVKIVLQQHVDGFQIQDMASVTTLSCLDDGQGLANFFAAIPSGAQDESSRADLVGSAVEATVLLIDDRDVETESDPLLLIIGSQ